MDLSSIREDRRSDSRPLFAALTLSVLVHLLGFLLFVATQKFTLAALPRPHPTQTPEFVALSQAITIDKKAVPVPQSRPRRPLPPPARPVVPEPPHQAAPEPQREVVAPTLPPVPTERPEVSRPGPHAAPTVAPTAPPAPARVAEAPAERPDHLNSQRIAQLEQNFSRTIAQARNEANPLRVPPATPSAPKHYRMQFEGHFGPLHNGQGEYWPIQSWRDHGVDCYYMQYDFVYEDGRFEHGSVPWPVCFAPRADPFANEDLGRLRRTPLPPPPPGWTLQNVAALGKALREYFPNTSFPQE